MNNKQLDVYIASAGSGKTHTLTREYLKLALRNPNYFRHIQAVTFTNKATAEMKERIIQELYTLSVDPHSSSFYNDLIESLNINDNELNERARKTLKAILTNYGSFRVKTIDSFFQEVIRSFFRELDIPANFELQLDKNKVIEDAIVRLIYDQRNSKGKTSLQIYAKEQVESGQGHNLVRKMRKLASQLFREDVKKYYTEKGENAFPDTKKISDIKKNFYSHISTHKDEIKRFVDDFFVRFNEYDIDLSDISYGTSGVFSVFYSFRDKFNETFKKIIIKNDIPKRFLKYLEDRDDVLQGILKKTASPVLQEKIKSFMNGGTLDLMYDFYNKILDKKRLFTTRTINTILKNIDELGLLSDIKTCIDTINKENNTILIDNNANLLRQIIDNSDTPFIYEKIGSYIFHYMIDEFQDTSAMQYDNFMPLIKESLATHFSNLVVGDVKQSIYRFRNSDSNLLNTEIKRELKDYIDIHNLKDNWRSCPNVICFNNALYKELPKFFRNMIEDLISDSDLPDGLKNTLSAKSEEIEDYYVEVEQNVPDRKFDKQGRVAIHQFEGEYNKTSIEEILKSLVDTIAYLQTNKGYKPSDIAILTRKNQDAATIVEYLMDEENTKGYDDNVSFNVVSQEALNLNGSIIVRLIIQSFQYISRTNYPINREALLDSYRVICKNRGVKPQDDDTILQEVVNAGKKTLYSSTETLIELYSDIINDDDTPYLLKLLEVVSKTKSSKTVDFDEFIEYWQQEGVKEKVVLPENDRAVSLMTIHKSKGLGFKVVLMPMLYADIIEDNPMNQTIIWSDSHVKKFNINNEYTQILKSFDYRIPITYNSELKDTAFAEDYFDETIKKAIDSLNLFYVASTRAKEELHLWLSNNEGKNKGTIGNALFQVITKNIDKKYFDELYVSDELYKNVDVNQEFEKQDNRNSDNGDIIILPRILNLPIENRIAILREGLNYFEDNNPRKHGSVMHRILSRIISKEDIDIQLNKAVIDGLILKDEAQEIKTEIKNIIESNIMVAQWFDKKNKILTEIPIIGADIQGSQRPDRVVIYHDNTADIIDYKFGQKEDKYKYQVKRYMRHLNNMGYRTRGFLWYINEESCIEEVF